MYVYTYNTAEQRYYMYEVTDAADLEKTDFDVQLHRGAIDKMTAITKDTTCCPVCKRKFVNAHDRMIHQGFFGVCVQQPSTFSEYDEELKDSGIVFTLNRIVEKRVLHSLNLTLVSSSYKSDEVCVADLQSKIAAVMDKRDKARQRLAKQRDSAMLVSTRHGPQIRKVSGKSRQRHITFTETEEVIEAKASKPAGDARGGYQDDLASAMTGMTL